MAEDSEALTRLLHDAVARSREERLRLIASTRVHDPDLAARLETLLATHDLPERVLRDTPLLPGADESTRLRPAGRLAPGERLGPYQVTALLGVGGMGEVYRARDERLGRDVAVKILPHVFASDPDRRRRMEQEARAVGMLNHPNTLVVHDIGVHDRSPFIVSELLEGETLRTRLERIEGQRGMAAGEACAIVREIAAGLGAAHARGIVHRDLKPENVFITLDGRLKILDFGLARVTSPSDGEHQLNTVSGVVLGTFGYMAPEQIRGQRAGPPADVFAAGTILYELLTGRRPFAGDTAADTTAAVLTGVPTPLRSVCPDASPALVAIVDRCLAKTPQSRYQSGAELSAALARAIAAEARPVGEGSRWSRRSRGGAVAAVGLALVAIAVAGVLLWRTAGPGGTEGATSQPSVVLLPTRVFGAPESEFLTDAVPANLSSYLSQVQGLITNVPPTADEVARVKGDVQRIADAYGANTCVLTTMTAQGPALVLSVQLVEPASRRVIWSGQYEGGRDSYLAMLQRAAGDVQNQLVPAAAPAAPLAASFASNSAELAFQSGEYFLRRYDATFDRAAFEAARKAYEEVLVLDPARADAPARLSMLSLRQVEAGQLDPAAGLREMTSWAEKAIGIDQTSPTAWAALAGAELSAPQPDLPRALVRALNAALHGARCSDCHGAVADVLAGSAFTLALAATEEGHRLDPLSLVFGGNRAFSLMTLGRSAEAKAAIAKARALERDNPWTMLQESLILADTGDVARAQQLAVALERAVRDERLAPGAYLTAKTAIAVAARSPDAARDLAEVQARIADRTRSHYDRLMQQLVVAPRLAAVGRHADALDLLESGAAHDVVVPFDWLMLDPRLAALRSQRRFAVLTRTAKVPFDAARATLADAAARGRLPPYLTEPLQQLAALDAQFNELVARQIGPVIGVVSRARSRPGTPGRNRVSPPGRSRQRTMP